MMYTYLILTCLLIDSCYPQGIRPNATSIEFSDGQNSNVQIGEYVIDIYEYSQGDLWFGTRVAEKDNPDAQKRMGKGGLSKFDGVSMNIFPEVDGLSSSDVYCIYKDISNKIWISTMGTGVYSFDNGGFEHYKVPISIMGMWDDKNENLWLSGVGGLYRINKRDEIVNVTTTGPWQ